MKFNRKIPFVALCLVGALAACGTTPEVERKAHKDEAIYSATIDGVTRTGLTWKESYDAVIAKTKVTTGEARNEYLHQAEDILMSTGAIVPIYYYTDIFMMNTKMTGFYSSPLGYKFFHKAAVNGATEFSVCVGPKADSIDPAINSAVDGAIVISHAFEGLYRWKTPTIGTTASELEPGQAASYVKTPVGSEGHVKYTFTLRDGLKFSDGTPLKASDFARSWARAASGKLVADYGYMFDCVVGYEATSADTTQYLPLSGVVADDAAGTLEVELVSDVPYFLELTAFPTYAPVKMSVVENDGWWTSAATYIGNGPMKFTTIENENGKAFVAEPNENYWDRTSVTATKVRFQLTDDDSNQLMNFENGSWAFIDSVPNNRIESLKTRDDYFVNGQLGTYYVIFNVNDHALDKVLDTESKLAEFRKAVSLLIDRNYICKEIGQAGQEPANTFVGKGIKETNNGVTKDWTERSGVDRDGKGYFSVAEADYESNCAEAVEKIKSLGFTYDEEQGMFTDIPSMSYLYNDGTAHKAIGEYLQGVLAPYGINLTLDSQEWAVFLNSRKNGDYSLARNGWLADYNDACSFLDMWTTESGNNDAQFGR